MTKNIRCLAVEEWNCISSLTTLFRFRKKESAKSCDFIALLEGTFVRYVFMSIVYTLRVLVSGIYYIFMDRSHALAVRPIADEL